ncbi:MAG: universal stress protein [Gemmatimonadetes bacterium]|nr:universal stress protein [Gemmatimonadota bacterium]
MPARIIVPLDGSTFAEDALATAMALVDESGSLDLVTVTEGAPPFAVPEYEELAREWALEYLDGLTEKLPPGIQAHSVPLVGRPSERLRSFIEDSEADLVVMATHGRGPLTRAWLGSVADSLIRGSRLPLLLVHPQDPDEPSYQADLPLRKILVPLDGSSLAESAVDGAISILGQDLDLTLLRVVQSPIPSLYPYVPDATRIEEESARAKAQAEEHLAEVSQKYQGVARSVGLEVIDSDHVGRAIVELAEASDFDAIAIATHGRGGVGRFALGSVADKVIRSTRLPVLTLRP